MSVILFFQLLYLLEINCESDQMNGCESSQKPQQLQTVNWPIASHYVLCHYLVHSYSRQLKLLSLLLKAPLSSCFLFRVSWVTDQIQRKKKTPLWLKTVVRSPFLRLLNEDGEKKKNFIHRVRKRTLVINKCHPAGIHRADI